ncbi:MAG: hypothetical protein ACRCV5_02660 [Afipia sp.]
MSRKSFTITSKFNEITKIGDVFIQIVRGGHTGQNFQIKISAPKDVKIEYNLYSRAKNREKKNAENVQADEKSASVASQRVDSLSGDPVAQSSDRVTGGGNG